MKTSRVKRALAFALTLVLCLQLSLTNDAGVSKAASAAKLSTKKITLNVGKKKTIKIKNKKKKATYTFSTSKKKVATVSKKGVVTAKKKGTAYITVKQKYNKKVKKLGKVKVTVKNASKKVTDDSTTPAGPTTPTAAPTTPTVAPSTNPTTPTTQPTVTPTPAPTEEPALIDVDFEDGAKGNFTQMGNVTLTVIDGGHDSKKCLEVSGRTANWNGTDYNLADIIKTGEDYEISAWVKQDSGEALAANITYCYSPADGGDTKYSQAATATAESGEWTKLEGVINVPEGASGYKFYVEIGDAESSFCLDDVRMTGKKAEVNEPNLDEFKTTYYDEAVKKSFVSTGNTYRMKKVIEKAKNGDEVNIAFIGGSITEGADLSSNADCYANQAFLEFKEKYGKDDGSNVHYVNAGMSGTPSALGSIRYERDVVQALGGKEPDLVFVEFAVNDGGNQELNVRTYESFVRSLLSKENAPAVMLIFSVFDTGYNMQEYYKPVGEAYSLPMVSIKNGITAEIAAGHISTKQFFNMTSATPGLHPNPFGAKFMADCIMNTISSAALGEDDKDSELPSEVVFAESTKEGYDSIKGDSFEGVKMIDPNTIPEEVKLTAGDFKSTDTNVGTFLFNNKSKFPTNWQHAKTAGAESFKMTVNCKNMLLAYKLSSSADAGEAEIYVDGNKVVTLNSYSSSGWNNAETALIFNDEKAASHEVEVKMASGSEAKEFTILTLGYTK